LPAWLMAAFPLVTTPPVGAEKTGVDMKSPHPHMAAMAKDNVLFFSFSLLRLPWLHFVCTVSLLIVDERQRH
jgi:hypothetical protein